MADIFDLEAVCVSRVLDCATEGIRMYATPQRMWTKTNDSKFQLTVNLGRGMHSTECSLVITDIVHQS